MAVISAQHGFIFVKTTKTGGTSVEVELSKLVEKRAIVTPVIPPEPGHDPRNYRRGPLRKPFYNHMPAALIRRYLGDKAFFGSYRFCVERDPITKCISHFHMLANSSLHRPGNLPPLSWAEYVEAGEFPIDVDKYVDWVDGRRQLVVNEVIPYETMQEDLARIGRELGIGPINLSVRAKAGYSKERLVRPADVTPEQRRRIMVAFAETLHFSGLAERYEPTPAGAGA